MWLKDNYIVLISSFGLVMNTLKIIYNWWKGQADGYEQHRWAYLFNTGDVDGATAESWADVVPNISERSINGMQRLNSAQVR